MATMIIARGLYQSQPPDLQTKSDMNPTLLVSWWCTGFALAAILIRVGGRFVRTERLFREDKIMMWSAVPLLIRMALVHVILIWGTNNTKTAGLTPTEVHDRQIGARLVLASRIFYAMFIWMAKWSILEFLKRLVGAFWHTSYEIGLQVIRYFLIATFIAVIISTLAECQPFDHYWQVVPDPGPHCREGIAQLMTMGVCDIITDLVLVVFPIPIVIMSEMPFSRKVSLIGLFALSLGLVGLTSYRLPSTISRRSAQQFRSLIASCEVLAAAAVTNAIVIGSFIRDRGVKKAKFKHASRTGSTAEDSPTVTRQQTMTVHHWGSDEDLVRDLGMRLHPTLQHRNTSMVEAIPAPVALPNHNAMSEITEESPTMNPNFTFSHTARGALDPEKGSVSSTSTGPKLHDIKPAVSNDPASPGGALESAASRKPSFFDVGELLDANGGSTNASAQPSSEPLISSDDSSVHDFATNNTSRRGSRAFLSDIGGLLAPHREESDMDRSTRPPPAARKKAPAESSPARNFSRGNSAYIGQPGSIPGYDTSRDAGGPSIATTEQTDESMDFVDVGGLLK